jgi:hypothetical protein
MRKETVRDIAFYYSILGIIMSILLLFLGEPEEQFTWIGSLIKYVFVASYIYNKWKQHDLVVIIGALGAVFTIAQATGILDVLDIIGMIFISVHAYQNKESLNDKN